MAVADSTVAEQVPIKIEAGTSKRTTPICLGLSFYILFTAFFLPSVNHGFLSVAPLSYQLQVLLLQQLPLSF